MFVCSISLGHNSFISVQILRELFTAKFLTLQIFFQFYVQFYANLLLSLIICHLNVISVIICEIFVNYYVILAQEL